MNRYLLRYVFADSTAVLADNYFFVYLALIATMSGATPTQIGLLLAVYAIPRLVLLLPGGTVADRFSPRMIMTIGNAIQALGMAMLAVGFAAGGVPLEILFLVAIVFGIVDAFTLPAVTAAPVRLVARDKLFKANRLRDGVGSVFQTVGFFAPGLAVTFTGLGTTAWIGCGLYCISAVLFASVRFAPPEGEYSKETKVLEGFKYAWRSLPIRTNLLLQAIVNFATFGPLIVGLLLLLEAHDFEPVMYSSVLVAYSVGGIIGALVCTRFELTTRRGLILLGEILLIAVALSLMAFTANIAVLCACFAVLGGYSILTGVLSDTWRQHETANALQGRVGSVKVLITELMKSASRSVTGVAVALLGLQGMFMAVGVIILVAAGLLLHSRHRDLLEPTGLSKV